MTALTSIALPNGLAFESITEWPCDAWRPFVQVLDRRDQAQDSCLRKLTELRLALLLHRSSRQRWVDRTLPVAQGSAMLQPFSHCIHDGTAIEALFPDTGPIARNPVPVRDYGDRRRDHWGSGSAVARWRDRTPRV